MSADHMEGGRTLKTLSQDPGSRGAGISDYSALNCAALATDMFYLSMHMHVPMVLKSNASHNSIHVHNLRSQK